MKTTKRLLSMALVLVLMMSAFVISAYADHPEANKLTEQIDTKSETTYAEYMLQYITNGEISDKIKLVKLADYNDDENWIYKSSGDDGDGYYYYLKDGVTMDELISSITQLYNSNKSIEQIQKIDKETKVEADIDAGMDSIHGLVPIVNWVLGIATVGISLMLGIATALDIVYIAFPVFQENVNNTAQQNPNMNRPDPKNGGTRPVFVSSEAMFAVKAAAADPNGKNPLAIYFGKRVFAYIMVSVVLFILLTGNISIITNLALRVVAPVMNVIANLGK